MIPIRVPSASAKRLRGPSVSFGRRTAWKTVVFGYLFASDVLDSSSPDQDKPSPYFFYARTRAPKSALLAKLGGDGKWRLGRHGRNRIITRPRAQLPSLDTA